MYFCYFKDITKRINCNILKDWYSDDKEV